MNTTQKIYQEKRSSIERLDNLEQNIPKMIVAIGKQLDPLINFQNEAAPKLAMFEEFFEVLVDIAGTDLVTSKLRALRLKRVTENANAQKAEVQAKLASGEIVATDKVGHGDIVVLAENDENGVVVEPGWFLTSVQNLIPEVKEQVIGQEVGFLGKNKDRTFLLKEIYTPVAPKAEAQGE